MIREVYPQIFLNEIPLPKNPLKALNSYIIRSESQSLIIDTGFNLQVCRNAFMDGIKELDISLSNTKLLLTHMHPDHSGLAPDLIKEGAKAFIGKVDGEILNNIGKPNEQYSDSKKLFDLEEQDLNTRYIGKIEPIDYIPLNEGDEIEVGNYLFEVIDIPGHTPGHIGLYERKHQLFFCGDHILDRISPNITVWGLDQDILATYLNSLEKVSKINIDYLFTGHRDIIRNHEERIDQIYQHHINRLKEIIQIIQQGRKSIRQTAEKMHWDLSDRWEDFSDMQKWFAAGEAMSHLEHLVAIGLAKRTCYDDTLFYEYI